MIVRTLAFAVVVLAHLQLTFAADSRMSFKRDAPSCVNAPDTLHGEMLDEMNRYFSRQVKAEWNVPKEQKLVKTYQEKFDKLGSKCDPQPDPDRRRRSFAQQQNELLADIDAAGDSLAKRDVELWKGVYYCDEDIRSMIPMIGRVRENADRWESRLNDLKERREYLERRLANCKGKRRSILGDEVLA